MRINPDRNMHRLGRDARGFTLIELMVTLVVMAVVVVVLMAVMYNVARNKTAQTNRIDSSQGARVVTEMLGADLRSAGYGADDTTYVSTPQQPIAYIDSVQVLINANFLPYPDTAAAGPQSPSAYNPAGSPKPFPLTATLWTPPGKYRTGAELVRWTLDTNNDGVVNAADVAGTDAANTPNPNDYTLMRQVYGDIGGGSNGGSQQAVAQVRLPGGSVPALFTVYLHGSATAWNWNNGPIPPARLNEVERIVVNATVPSPRADSKGVYSETSYRTEVASMRNIPNFGIAEYSVSGYVYDDKNTNRVYDVGDLPIANAAVRLGSVTGLTSPLGYYMLHATAGTYTLRQTPPAGYGVYTAPDTAVISLGPSTTFSFADTAAHGGWVNCRLFDDQDADGVDDGTSTLSKAGFRYLIGTTLMATTTSAGTATIFVPPGNFSISITPADTFTVTTTNPLTGTMTDGGTLSFASGIAHAAMSQVKGKVFIDTNKNGTLDGSEVGLANAWVGCTTDGGVTILDYITTDASGSYSLDVPSNNPPGTVPYSILCIPPNGYYGTSTTAINNVLLTAGQVLTGKNFGVATFQIISLNSSRVLSLGTGDLMEKDYNGSHLENAHQDMDLVLGADSNGSDQISVWFNNYDSSPTFSAARDYSRSAPNSVISLVVDSLDSTPPAGRQDLVTGCKTAASGNFFVWFCQKTSGNQGYFSNSYNQAYRTNDNGDVQAVQTGDIAGGSGCDILVGTNAGSYRGTLEVWQSNDALTPTFTRQEIYPPAGSIPANPSWIGEVSSMVMADLDKDGDLDLVVGTRTGSSSGEILIFKFNSKTTGNRFIYRRTLNCNDQVNCLVATDVDGDGWLDLVAGTQHNSSTGDLMLWRNEQDASGLAFTNTRTVNAPGIPISIGAADFGGLSRSDIVMGFRNSTGSYVGGVRIYNTDTGTIPVTGSDPTGGQVTNMVPALTISNFNYGVKPSIPAPPYLADLAVGVKITDTTGALVVMIR